MTTPIGVALTIVEAAWMLATVTVPFLYLVFAADALLQWRDASLLDALVTGQRSYTLHYGLYVIGGLFLGSPSAAVLQGPAGLVAGAGITAVTTLYAHATIGRPELHQVGLDSWNGRVRLPWLLVPALSAAAIVTWDPLLRSAVGLVFLSAVFWEV